MATVPKRTLIAVVGHDDIVSEVVSFDRTFDLVRDCKKLVDISEHPEIGVGYTLKNGGWSPPAKKEGE